MVREFDPWNDRAEAVERLLCAREEGATLRQAAAAAGVHVATVCRWARCCPLLDRSLAFAARVARRRRFASMPRRRPSVPWHPACPCCGAAVVVRTCIEDWARKRCRGGYWPLQFWRCGRWPDCPWANWRPRYPEDCPACGGPRYWSHSRKSVSCPRCPGARWLVS
jgi:hypothetical protein